MKQEYYTGCPKSSDTRLNCFYIGASKKKWVCFLTIYLLYTKDIKTIEFIEINLF